MGMQQLQFICQEFETKTIHLVRMLYLLPLRCFLGTGHYLAGGGGGALLILGGGSLFFELKFGEVHFFSVWI